MGAFAIHRGREIKLILDRIVECVRCTTNGINAGVKGAVCVVKSSERLLNTVGVAVRLKG